MECDGWAWSLLVELRVTCSINSIGWDEGDVELQDVVQMTNVGI